MYFFIKILFLTLTNVVNNKYLFTFNILKAISII